MDLHPREEGLRYVRTDVSGAYRWEPATSTWKQIVTSTSMPADYVEYGKYLGVDSLVAAPGDPEVAYMAFGGEIFRSGNRGDKWIATSFAVHKVRMEPNGEGRQEGERLRVDPHNSKIVYFGSIADGLWITEDAGMTWRKVAAIPRGAPPHGVNTIAFDESSGVVVTGEGEAKTKVIYVTADQAGIFRSADAGVTWTDIVRAAPRKSGSIRDAKIGPDGTYYVAYDSIEGAGSSIWKRSSSGIWKDITPPGEQRKERSHCEIAIDPSNSRRLVAMSNGGRCFASQDQGDNWTPHGFHLNSSKIRWLGEQENYWLSVGALAFDPCKSGRLWFAEGFGVWWTDNLSSQDIEWQAESAGIEETCGNDIICPPGGKPLAAMWDVGVFRFENPDVYSARRAFPYFISAWALDWCASDPQFIAAVFRNHLDFGPHVNESGYSTDGGATWTIFPAVQKKEIPQDLAYGTIAVSANSPDKIVWAPAHRALPYYTVDRGGTWKQSFLGQHVTSTGFDDHSSPQKPLCADRVQPDTFYFYHAVEGIFRSEDGGATFAKTGGLLPGNRVNSVLKAVPGHAGHLLFAEGSQGNPVGGIWHSNDGGRSWRQLPFIEQAFNFGLGKSKEENGYPAIFVAGVAQGQTGIYRSVDEGTTWARIASYPLGIFDWIDAMDGDKDVFGKLYLGFAGAGFAQGEEVDR